MLTPERHRRILELLKNKNYISIHELVDTTGSSESTIRRDLSQLEDESRLVRVHGGAQAKHSKSEETTIMERQTAHLKEKEAIAIYAAEKVKPGECIFLDAGTTTSLMIPYLRKDIIVVTNGISLISSCMERRMETYVIGGKIKEKTNALIGKGAVDSLQAYRFDKAFIGMNGIHIQFGLTTPDPEEALIKRSAIALATESFVLADQTKFGQVTFSSVENFDAVTILTDGPVQNEQLAEYQRLTKIEVVNK